MGMAKIFSDADAGTAANSYEYALYGAADELTPQLLQGGVDIAAVPLNLASVLYNKTSGGVKLCAVGVLGVLYITEFNGETVQSLADLKGKTVYATGKGSTPEYFLRYLLAENGLDLDTDVTVEWKSEPSESRSSRPKTAALRCCRSPMSPPLPRSSARASAPR